MNRTWQANSDTINGLWPQCQWTDEEIDLWRSDLAGLDQDVLFEAIREVKRSKESLYPQLVWIHAAYRTLFAAKRAAERTATAAEPAFTGDKLTIDPAESRRLADEIAREIDAAGPDDFQAIEDKIAENTDRMDALVAARLSWRCSARRVHGGRSSRGSDAPIRVAEIESDDEFEARRAAQLRIVRGSA